MLESKMNPPLPRIELEEARELCATFQWTVIETSFADKIETLTPAGLKSNISRVKQFHQDAHKGRTAQLFKESLERFAARLALLANSRAQKEPPTNAEKLPNTP
jgi:hypothetical protein